MTAVSPTTGARGTTGLTVTLTGVGFTGATQATFLLNNVADSAITSSVVSVSADGPQATLQVSIAAATVESTSCRRRSKMRPMRRLKVGPSLVFSLPRFAF